MDCFLNLLIRFTCINCFADSDWGGCPDDRRSIDGFAVYLGSNLISWNAKKQPTIARSSTKGEYKSLANVSAEVLWIQSLFHELQEPAIPKLFTLWCDNVGAI